MEKYKRYLRCCLAALAGAAAFSWFFPQIAFEDSVKAVIPEERQKEIEGILTPEDCIKLFRVSESNFKIAWKFAQNH
ncbi:MAG: hypothetical protein Q4C50_05355 [Eubacteriales bacterium]|nr:hypothetical protein [Eubacteriales bacterium]